MHQKIELEINEGLPANSRPISEEKIKQKLVLRILPFLQKYTVMMLMGLSLIILLAISAVSWDIVTNLQKEHLLLAKKADLQKQIYLWQAVVQKHPDYRDAYIKLALLEYQVKNYKASAEYTKKSLEIDPNYDIAKKIEQILQK